jgi:hypothetical protein
MKTVNNSSHAPPSSIEKRLRRIESRLVQLMIHMGLNPYAKTYEGDESDKSREQKDGNGTDAQ